MAFQAFRPATENALSAKRVLVLVTLKSPSGRWSQSTVVAFWTFQWGTEEPCRASRQTLTRVTCTLYVSPLVANVVSSVVTHAISFSLFLQLCEFCTEQHNRVNGSTKTPTVRQRTRHLAGHLAPHWRSSIFPAHIAHRSVPPTNYFCCCNDGVGGFSFGLYILARLVSA